jgi:hypothetical protein
MGNGQFVESARERYAPWDLGNEAQYDLCRKQPGHPGDDVILAAVYTLDDRVSRGIRRVTPALRAATD